MSRSKKKKKKNITILQLLIIIFIIFYIVPIVFGEIFESFNNINNNSNNNVKSGKNVIKILSSYENQFLENDIIKYGNKNNISVSFTYKGDIDIVEELNSNSKNYDAVWISNSMWLYMLDNMYLTSDSKSISISPVVIGIRKNKAQSLGLIDKQITNNEFLKLIQDKKISYVMNSVTSTNTGATAYFGFLNSLAGNPEVLTEEMIDDVNLQNNLITLFSGVERVSGDEDFLKEMFINDDKYEAVIADESDLININKQLKEKGKEQLYILYPTDGIQINDSTFAFINNGYDNEDAFLILQKYLLSEDGRKLLEENGKRTWYGGIKEDADENIFNKEWGIDTTKYLNVTKYPSKNVMTYALNMYVEKFRKPVHIAFVLDYSGSMYGSGKKELTNAMKYILDYDVASKDRLQFSENDKITIVPFSTRVYKSFETTNGKNTKELIENIEELDTGGSTALYDAIIEALKILDKEEDTYNTVVVAMTDGAVNEGTFSDLTRYYKNINNKIPVYSITFGDAVEYELDEIAELTNAKVFDGKTNLLNAFKQVRGYN